MYTCTLDDIMYARWHWSKCGKPTDKPPPHTSRNGFVKNHHFIEVASHHLLKVLEACCILSAPLRGYSLRLKQYCWSHPCWNPAFSCHVTKNSRRIALVFHNRGWHCCPLSFHQTNAGRACHWETVRWTAGHVRPWFVRGCGGHWILSNLSQNRRGRERERKRPNPMLYHQVPP